MRQRKVAEGELRNSYYRESSPVKKRIIEIENEIAGLEAQVKTLESNFADPEAYKNTADITEATRKHHELSKTIVLLTEEYEQLIIEAERSQRAFDRAMNALDARFSEGN